MKINTRSSGIKIEVFKTVRSMVGKIIAGNRKTIQENKLIAFHR